MESPLLPLSIRNKKEKGYKLVELSNIDEEEEESTQDHDKKD